VAFASGVVYAMLQSNITVSWTGPLPQGIPDFRLPKLTLTLPNDTNYTVILANGTSIIYTLPNTTQTIPFWKIASVNSKFYLFFQIVQLLKLSLICNLINNNNKKLVERRFKEDKSELISLS